MGRMGEMGGMGGMSTVYGQRSTLGRASLRGGGVASDEAIGLRERLARETDKPQLSTVDR
jgi:hypothetical protein